MYWRPVTSEFGFGIHKRAVTLKPYILLRLDRGHSIEVLCCLGHAAKLSLKLVNKRLYRYTCNAAPPQHSSPMNCVGKSGDAERPK